jgi:hypothetical protein
LFAPLLFIDETSFWLGAIGSIECTYGSFLILHRYRSIKKPNLLKSIQIKLIEYSKSKKFLSC